MANPTPIPQAVGAAAVPATPRDLHAAIMNLPCCPYRPEPEFALGYKMGHKDARHAAAELALSASPSPASAPDECGNTPYDEGPFTLAGAPDAAPVGEPAAMDLDPEFTPTSRQALAWVLWHHQGGSSPVGQPIRFALGMGQHERMPDWMVADAKKWGEWDAKVGKRATPTGVAADEAGEPAWRTKGGIPRYIDRDVAGVAADERTSAAPDGWKLVPPVLEPTMATALFHGLGIAGRECSVRYKAMLDAAPSGERTSAPAPEDVADELAEAIAAHLGIYIGEHSSDNNPWRNALIAIQGGNHD